VACPPPPVPFLITISDLEVHTSLKGPITGSNYSKIFHSACHVSLQVLNKQAWLGVLLLLAAAVKVAESACPGITVKFVNKDQ
jgi:hypothetical protein